MAKVSKARQEECKAKLLDILQPGDTINCLLRHVSRSGTSRRIDFYKIEDGEMRWLSPYVGDLLGYSRPARGDGLQVSGCGMDMGFAVVYQLGATLWPNGTDKPHGRRNGEPDSDGGYALKHRWL